MSNRWPARPAALPPSKSAAPPPKPAAAPAAASAPTAALSRQDTDELDAELLDFEADDEVAGAEYTDADFDKELLDMEAAAAVS